MCKLTVALMQLMPEGVQEENLKKGLDACRRAKEMGADIALFPEMWNTGYRVIEEREKLMQQAIPCESRFVQSFAGCARALNMAVGITFLEKKGGGMRNTLCLFDRFGRPALTYAKVHTCDFDPFERLLTPGDDFPVCALDTEKGEVMVGAMICYDREFPESARILMLHGAELILVPNACPMEINRLSQLRGRAYENMLGIATCNYPAGQPDCNGHSSAFDGVVYVPWLSGSRDTCIAEAGGEEGIYLAQFDLDMMRDYRRREVHGNAFRRPKKYGALTEEGVREPFVRKEYRP